MASSDYQVVADATFSVLEIDLTGTPLLQHMFSGETFILDAFHYFNFQFAPSLADLLRAPKPPTAASLLACSLLTGLDESIDDNLDDPVDDSVGENLMDADENLEDVDEGIDVSVEGSDGGLDEESEDVEEDMESVVEGLDEDFDDIDADLDGVPDLRTHWIVYLQCLEKDGEPEVHIYCGSSVNTKGSDARLKTYDNYFNKDGSASGIPSEMIKLKKDGYRLIGTSVLAAAEIPEDELDFQFLRACMLLLEGALTAKFWFYKSSTLGRVTKCRLWPLKKISYKGLCSHSALAEVGALTVRNIFDDADMARDWKTQLEEKRKEISRAANRKHSKTDKRKVSAKRFRQSDKGKQAQKGYRATKKSKATQRRAKQKYAKSDKGKAVQRRASDKWQQSDNGKASTAKSSAKWKAKDENKSKILLSQRSWRQTESGKTATKKGNDKYNASEKGKAKRKQYHANVRKDGSAPDRYCDAKELGCSFKSKDKSNLNAHIKRCPFLR